MAWNNLMLAFGVIFASSILSLAVLWVLGVFKPSVALKTVSTEPATDLCNTFLLHGDKLVDHDVISMPDYLESIEDIRNWHDLRAWLSLRFDKLPKSLAELEIAELDIFEKSEIGNGLSLQIRKTGHVTRVLLRNAQPVGTAEWHAASLCAYSRIQSENTLEHVSFPIWKTNTKGEITWRNAALARIEKQLGEMPKIIPAARGDSALPRFCVTSSGGKQPRWYEVDEKKISPDEMLYVATGIDQVVRAETAQRDFVQTLTKTFANLTTGLAVFDKNRQLALFNPALVDLSGINVSFLSARPDVIRFFDELRERQVLPEPKNYADLRSQIREMIAKANEGNYMETWNLPGGVTYRVTGRPHPDGAVAFLIEDISAEVLKTRQFRSQIDLSQSVIDGLDEAIVVIAPNDLVLLCNTACSELLKIDPASSFADMSADDLIRACRDVFKTDALWTIFENSVRDGLSQNASHDRYLNRHTDERLQYRIKILPGGSRMIGFSKVRAEAIAPSFTAAE